MCTGTSFLRRTLVRTRPSELDRGRRLLGRAGIRFEVGVPRLEPDKFNVSKIGCDASVSGRKPSGALDDLGRFGAGGLVEIGIDEELSLGRERSGKTAKISA